LEPPHLPPLDGLESRLSLQAILLWLVVVVVVLDKAHLLAAVAVQVVCCLEQHLLIRLFPIR
jgi:hypothetical protein